MFYAFNAANLLQERMANMKNSMTERIKTFKICQ